MYQFNYHKPDSLQAARELFGQADDPMYLSGGMTLIPTMKQRLAAPTDRVRIDRDTRHLANRGQIDQVRGCGQTLLHGGNERHATG